MKRKYYVYIIQSRKDESLYIGVTNNLSRRLFEHNDGRSVYTKSKVPWKLIWYCAFGRRDKADDFEKYLKSGSGRVFIKKRILGKSAGLSSGTLTKEEITYEGLKQ